MDNPEPSTEGKGRDSKGRFDIILHPRVIGRHRLRVYHRGREVGESPFVIRSVTKAEAEEREEAWTEAKKAARKGREEVEISGRRPVRNKVTKRCFRSSSICHALSITFD